MTDYLNKGDYKTPRRRFIYSRFLLSGRKWWKNRGMTLPFLFILVCGLLTGCSGKNNSNGNIESSFSDERVAQGQAEAQIKEFNERKEKMEEEATPTPELFTEKHNFKANSEIYTDNIRSIKALGLKEYTELKSENYDKKKQKGYLDRPEKGKKYLVLFLGVRNSADEDVYFHPDYLSAKVDGKSVTHTFLKNAPEEYKTIFKNVKAGDYNEGFIVWEVPENWKKMVMTFKGFEPLGGKRLKLTMTPKDLKDPDAPSKVE